MGETVTKYASTPGQTFTATFDVTPLASGPVPTVQYFSDALLTTSVSGPTNLTQVSGRVWTVPVPDLAAQTLYVDYAYKTEVGGVLLHSSNDILRLVAADVLSGDGLCTLAEAKIQLGKNLPTNDDEIRSWISAVTAPVEDLIGPVLPRPVTEDHAPRGCELVLRQPPLLSVTSLTEYLGSTGYAYTEAANPAAGASYTYLVDPSLNGIITRVSAAGPLPFTGPVRVVYQAGLAAVPFEVNMAARLLVQYLWRTRNGGAGLPNLSDEPSPYDDAEISRAKTLLIARQRVSGIA